MKLDIYLSYNGNCEEAIALYEKAFDVKANIIMRYKDAPPEEEYTSSAETGNLVMHSEIKIGNDTLMLADMPPEDPPEPGTNFAVHAVFDGADAARKAFEVLRDGGVVGMELQETFWSKYFGSLQDRFGVCWNITVNETRMTEEA